MPTLTPEQEAQMSGGLTNFLQGPSNPIMLPSEQVAPVDMSPVAVEEAPVVDIGPDGEDVSEQKNIKTEKKLPMDPLTLVKFQRAFDTDVNNRRQLDAEWFIRDNYVKGNHFVKWNTDTSSVESVSSDGVIRFPINKIYSTLRSVRGFVTKYDPKWEVFPANKSQKAIDEAGYKGKLLDYHWYINNLRDFSKQKVFQALKYSVGIMELGWDKEKESVTFTIQDPYDIFFGGVNSANVRRITKAVKRNIDEVKNDPMYKGYQGTISPEGDDYISNAKQMLTDLAYGRQSKDNELDNTTIVKEMLYVPEKKNSLGGTINLISFTSTACLRHIETPYTDMSDKYLIYRSDDNPGEMYGEGWVKHLMPVQKMLDILESQTMEYHHMFAKGRYIVARNAGVKIINNKNGVILEHNAGRRPIVENAPSMAASVDNQINRFNVYIEDLGGQHDASLGRIPSGATAGIAIEALQEGDANNLKDLTENFQIDLVNTARAIFKMYAINLKTTKLVETDDKNDDGLPDYYAIIGENAPNIPDFVTYKGQKIPVCVIRKQENIRVTVGSWLAFTRDAMEQRVYKHYTAGLIDRNTALKALKYTDTDGIVDAAIKEQMIATLAAQGPQQPTAEPTPPVSDLAPGQETAPAGSSDAAIPMPI